MKKYTTAFVTLFALIAPALASANQEFDCIADFSQTGDVIHILGDFESATSLNDVKLFVATEFSGELGVTDLDHVSLSDDLANDQISKADQEDLWFDLGEQDLSHFNCVYLESVAGNEIYVCVAKNAPDMRSAFLVSDLANGALTAESLQCVASR